MQLTRNNNLKYKAGELQGLKTVVSYLWDGEAQAFAALYFIKAQYKDWPNIFLWLKRNGIRGKKLVEFFNNHSPDGGGYHMGATFILSRLKGHKDLEVGIKMDELQ